MAIVRVPYADADANAPCRDCASSRRWQYAPLKRIFGKPNGCKIVGLCRLGQRDTSMRIEPAMKSQADICHVIHFISLFPLG